VSWEKAYEELTWCQADDIIKLCPKEREKITMPKGSEELTNARKDELDEYLKRNYPENYISGEQDCNLLLWGKNGTEPKMFSLNIGVEYSPLEGLKGKTIGDIMNQKYRGNSSFKRLMKYGEEISSKSHMPFVIIVYPSLRETYGGKWADTERVYNRKQVLFYWFDISKKVNGKIAHEIIKGEQLRKQIYSALEVCFTDEGTGKDENSHLSDYFHFWSRQTLSRNITKLDIDGIIINNLGNKGVLVEIKRSSKPPIPDWKPKYDKANYKLESNYAKRIFSYFWLLHHESRPCDDDEIISFYNIVDVDEAQSVDFVISNETILEMSVAGNHSLKEKISKFINE